MLYRVEMSDRALYYKFPTVGTARAPGQTKDHFHPKSDRRKDLRLCFVSSFPVVYGANLCKSFNTTPDSCTELPGRSKSRRHTNNFCSCERDQLKGQLHGISGPVCG